MSRLRTWVLVPLLVLAAGCTGAPRERSFSYERFGAVHVYLPRHPQGAAILLSGNAGWKDEAVAMARTLADDNVLVLGVDLPGYLKALAGSWDRELYPEADLEALSQFAQKKLALPSYLRPVLVGYGAGATLAYAALAQGAPNTFRGAISLAFCPELVLPKPLGREYALDWRATAQTGRYRLLPAAVPAPWIVLQGSLGRACPLDEVRTFVKRVPQARLVELPGIADDLTAHEDLWQTPLRQALAQIAASAPADHAAEEAAVKDLPLVEVPPAGAPRDIMAVILSGDGGWASIDREIGNALAARGIAVVGFSSLKYFWTRRTPDGAARDLARVLRYYPRAWHKRAVMLIGFSLGADVLPFMANRLPKELLAEIPLIALLAPGRSVSFEFHLSDWLWDQPHASGLPIRPEVEKLRGMKILCFHGSDEKDSLCPELPPGLATTVTLPGGHHFGESYGAIAARILAAVAAPRVSLTPSPSR